MGDFVEVSPNESGPWELVEVYQAFTDADDLDNLGASSWIENDGICTYLGGYHVRDCAGKIVDNHCFYRVSIFFFCFLFFFVFCFFCFVLFFLFCFVLFCFVFGIFFCL